MAEKKRRDSEVSRITRKKLEFVLKTVLKDVKPTEEEMESTTHYVNDLVQRLKKAIPKNVEIVSVGSVARGTQIRGTSDIDIFLLFPKHFTKEQAAEKGMEVAKSIVAKRKNERFEIKYAQHPYVRLILGDMGLTADIVPAFKINNALERITAVDRTPLHNKFVNEHIDKEQKDNVRLLKAFLNAHGIHGADVETEGFSGYLCELLIYQYESFIDLITKIADLQLPLVILPSKKVILNPKSAEAKVLVKKFDKDFVVVDPTDDNRNVAAAVSKESLARFVVASRLLLRSPTLDFFYGPKYSDVYTERKLMRLRKELGLDIYLLHFKVKNVAEDIIWQQLRRFKARLNHELLENGFDTAVSFENVSKDNGIIAFFMKTYMISHYVAKGPSIYMREASSRFTDAHTKSLGIMFDGDRLVSLEESTHKTPKDVILHAMKSRDGFPSSLRREDARLFVNDMPEQIAKLLYAAFVKKTSI